MRHYVYFRSLFNNPSIYAKILGLFTPLFCRTPRGTHSRSIPHEAVVAVKAFGHIPILAIGQRIPRV